MIELNTNSTNDFNDFSLTYLTDTEIYSLFKNTASKLNINTDTVYWISDTVRYIEEMIKLGEENYNNNKYPFGYCKVCESEFNSELINEYGITNCPWCGNPITQQTGGIIGQAAN